MADKRYPDSALGSGTHAAAATPHDTDELPFIPRQVYVGGAGNMVVRLVDSAADVTLVGLQAGQQLDYQLRYIRATGTTASNIVLVA